MEMKDDAAEFGDAPNTPMTMPQTEPASPACPDSHPTPEQLARANINPATGLATDYLNHFNEAIMLLDLVSTMPECLPDLMAWGPMSYQEHFAGSAFKHRELAVASYKVADPAARADLKRLTDAMTAILLAARDAMTVDGRAVKTTAGATKAAAQLRSLAAQAGAVINGRPNYQALFDTLFER
jgi:hypothetical protein